MTTATATKAKTSKMTVPSYPRREVLGVRAHQGATGSANDIPLSKCGEAFGQLFAQYENAAAELASAQQALTLIDAPNVEKLAKTGGVLGSLKAELDSAKDEAERAEMLRLAQSRVAEAEENAERLRVRRDDCAVRADYHDSLNKIEVITRKWNAAITKANALRDEALGMFAAEVLPLIDNHGGTDATGSPWPDELTLPMVAAVEGSAADGWIVHPSNRRLHRQYE